MKIQLLSDVHLEFSHFVAEKTDADVLVLAGDIGLGTSGVEWAAEQSQALGIPVVYVAGNHEFYGQTYPNLIPQLRAVAHQQGVSFLQDDVLVFGKTRFLGATLWTDFKLFGEGMEVQARLLAANRMNDYRQVRHSGGGRLNPLHTVASHKYTVEWLEAQLRKPWEGPTVVVTHHAPHELSALPAKASIRGHDSLTPAYVSDLTRLMGPRVDLWLHGHTHHSVDYKVNFTRVVANCRGYGPDDFRARHSTFDPTLVLEVVE